MSDSTNEKNAASEQAYIQKVLKRILNILKAKRLSQKEFAARCGFSTATTSKLLKGDTSLTLKQIHTICDALDIKPEVLLSETDNGLDSPDTIQQFLIDGPREAAGNQMRDGSFLLRYLLDPYLNKNLYMDSLLYDPNRPAFKGIINDPHDPSDVYYFYTKPTISEEKNSILKGILRFTPAGTPDNPYCEAELHLETGLLDSNNKPIMKHYCGEMFISLPMRTCYVVLVSPVYAEINMISFQHMFLNYDKLLCRMGGCLTTSVGPSHQPTMEKCIISRVELDDQTLQGLEGQLFVNTSKISIRKEILDQPIHQKLKERLIMAIEYNGDSDELKPAENKHRGITNTYYEIEEMKIRASVDLSSWEKIDLINQLRRLSDNPRYAKVANHVDMFLYNYIMGLPAHLEDE